MINQSQEASGRAVFGERSNLRSQTRSYLGFEPATLISDYEFFGRFLAWFAFNFCSCLIDCCFLFLSLFFLLPLSPIASPFHN